MTAADRAARASRADALCAGALARARGETGAGETEVALVAVGGYGRGELAPYSDLDVVLLHADDVDPGAIAREVWYPIWDSGATLDHAVRSLTEASAAARADLRIALGLLDARHVAGDPHLTLRLRTTLLAQWRADARDRLPELREMVRARGDRLGELAHASVPDLKESAGGLRDATVLKALVATWLVDVPHNDLERCRGALLDLRDVVHEVAGRGTDRVAAELWPDIAVRLGLPDEAAAQAQTRELGRRMTHLSRLTWRRVGSALERTPATRGARRPALVPVAAGVAVVNDEIVLDPRARPALDPTLLLRAAAEAAERDLVLAPATAARLARECGPLPNPWPAQARGLFIRLLAAGPGLLGVWETLDETGGLVALLPEWERIRLLPHASAVHRFTVDRHVLETCIEASAMIRRVARPDVLMVAALLHDIGKGELVEHSVAGEPIARAVATRIGMAPREVDLVATLVRRHLVLAETATTRDLEDPATIERVADLLRDVEEVELLAALTEADARATSPQAWTSWRATLVAGLVSRVRAHLAPAVGTGDDAELVGDGHALAHEEIPARLRADPDQVDVRVKPTENGAEVTVIARDRVRLLADAAAMLALQRVSVRAARAWTDDELGVSRWYVDRSDLDPAALRETLQAVAGGRVDPGDRLGGPLPARLEPSVTVRAEASERATVLEVRTADGPGVVRLVCAALATLDIAVRSAHVSTLGPQAVDVFYLQEEAAGALSEERSAVAAHAVRRALLGTVTLDPPPSRS